MEKVVVKVTLSRAHKIEERLKEMQKEKMLFLNNIADVMAVASVWGADLNTAYLDRKVKRETALAEFELITNAIFELRKKISLVNSDKISNLLADLANVNLLIKTYSGLAVKASCKNVTKRANELELGQVLVVRNDNIYNSENVGMFTKEEENMFLEKVKTLNKKRFKINDDIADTNASVFVEFELDKFVADLVV